MYSKTNTCITITALVGRRYAVTPALRSDFWGVGALLSALVVVRGEPVAADSASTALSNGDREDK